MYASYIVISIIAVSKDNCLLTLTVVADELQPNLRQQADK